VSLPDSLRALGVEFSLDAPMSRHGFWRIGGPADVLVVVTDTRQLAGIMALGQPVTVVGNGSNLLVADAGIRGIVVKLKGDFLTSELDGDSVMVCGAGLLNTVLLNRLKKSGLGGLGCLAGIPGTVGGAVVMNAGWRLGEICQQVVKAELVLAGGQVVTVTAEDLGFVYRRASGLPVGSVVSRVWLTVSSGETVDEESKAVSHWLGRRKATQPLNMPSCGSVFKNPEGDYAGRLIETSGLKGHKIGGAQISELHANFIVNLGGATAADVAALITLARQTVWTEHGVVLSPEVHAVGDWPSGPWPAVDA